MKLREFHKGFRIMRRKQGARIKNSNLLQMPFAMLPVESSMKSYASVVISNQNLSPPAVLKLKGLREFFSYFCRLKLESGTV